MKNIVVIDDEVYICNIIIETLDCFSDFKVHRFTNPVRAAEFISQNDVDLVLTDLVMGSHSGVEILETTLANHPDAVVILMTGYPTVKTAISVLKKGGYDYLIKPFKLEDLKSTIVRGLEHQRLKRENVELRSQIKLMKVADAMAEGMQLQPLLNLITEAAVKELPAVAASIILFDRKTGVQQLASICGKREEADVDRFLQGENPHCATVIETMQPYYGDQEVTHNAELYLRSLVSFPLISKKVLLGLLNIVYDDRFTHIATGQTRLVSLLASKAASAIESSILKRDLERSYMQTIAALANAIEARDRYTAGHTDRVFHLATILARKLGWNEDMMKLLRNGCLLHDIGKIGIPDSVLNKPGILTDEERNIMQRHPELGAKILGGVPFFKPIIPFILTHHERYDGTGYPQRLVGEEIPVEGRLLAVADTFDAITSDRPYRLGRSPEMAVEELAKNKGSQFDPVMVDLFIEAFEEGLITSDFLEEPVVDATLIVTS